MVLPFTFDPDVMAAFRAQVSKEAAMAGKDIAKAVALVGAGALAHDQVGKFLSDWQTGRQYRKQQPGWQGVL